jgi:hypothetical protein
MRHLYRSAADDTERTLGTLPDASIHMPKAASSALAASVLG